MLDASSEWWKYIPVSKLKELLNTLPEGIKYVTVSPVGELALLNKELTLQGIISISGEDISMFE